MRSAIFRALGFRRGHVTRLILIEAAVASVIAGVLGYLAGMGLSYVLLPSARRRRRVRVLDAVAGRRGRRVWPSLIGSLASLYPALHASRLDPTVALRAL